MKGSRLLIMLLVGIFLSACSSSHILVTSNKYHFPHKHSKILVAGVVKSKHDSLRSHLEKSMVNELTALGYNATSALQEFGPGGLAGPGQQETYLKLCNDGIDAVLVITLIDKDKEKHFRSEKSYIYPDNYYYDRIWSYQRIQADMAGYDKTPSGYFWEAILFNLSTLEAECTIQSPVFKSIKDNGPIPFEKLLVKEMLKEEILTRQKTSRLKPF